MSHIKKELDYFHIHNGLGWNQNWFLDWSMYDGGCGAVTACDLCIHLARQKGMNALYPYNAYNLNKKDYLEFSSIMKSYLHPSWQGIDTIERYLAGLMAYFHHSGINILETEGLSGTLSWQKAAKQIQEQIDSDILVTFLLLYHKNYALKDFQWHWFNLAGYEIFDTEFYVKAVTYGNFWWLNLQELWNTGYRKKGGIIHIFFIEN